MEKFNARLGYGIFVGVNRRSNEFWIADEEEVRKAKSCVKEKKWSEGNLKRVNWAPWKRYEMDEEAEPEGVTDEERKGEKEKPKGSEEDKGDRDRVVYVNVRDKVPRNFEISREDVEKHTGTSGCPGEGDGIP
eukprot:10621736-Karenia_brevis.AAC.1